MFEQQLTNLADALIEQKMAKPEDRACIIHGLKGATQILMSVLTTYLLGLLFELPLESLIFFASFSLIRTYAGGYHCKTAINCYFVSTGIIILILTIVKFTPQHYLTLGSFATLCFALPIIVKFAPVETATKPFNSAETAFFRKKTLFYLLLECLFVVLLVSTKQYIASYLISLGICTCGVLILFGVNTNRH